MAPATGDGGAATGDDATGDGSAMAPEAPTSGGGSVMATSGGSGGTAMAASAIHARAVLRETPHSRAAAETLPTSSGRSTRCARASALVVLRKAGPLGRSFFDGRGSAPSLALPCVGSANSVTPQCP